MVNISTNVKIVRLLFTCLYDSDIPFSMDVHRSKRFVLLTNNLQQTLQLKTEVCENLANKGGGGLRNVEGLEFIINNIVASMSSDAVGVKTCPLPLRSMP